MKYMGSKRYMLRNGLGELILRHSKNCGRIVDLFCGTGSIAWFAARNTDRSVLAVDLQTYAVTAAQAVVGRDCPLDSAYLITEWLEKVKTILENSQLWHTTVEAEKKAENTYQFVQESRFLCEVPSTVGPVWNAYGGHYFSPKQALTFDYLLKYLPSDEPERTVCLAAIIAAASRCAAAPGHTAQPFQPTAAAGIFLRKSWNRDPLSACKEALCKLAPLHAQIVGETLISDALDCTAVLQSDDLIIVDPPYSSVQYSRFYHVLETIARRQCRSVSGVGRYPPIEDRPQSEFSKKTQSRLALEKLISSLAEVGAAVIFTFPAGECSNGLSGEIVYEVARTYYNVEGEQVDIRFSTLGGNKLHRAARKPSTELLLFMRPKKTL